MAALVGVMAWWSALPGQMRMWIVIVAAVSATLGAVYLLGRHDGAERVEDRLERTEQRNRERANEAARDAERDGADERLRTGHF